MLCSRLTTAGNGSADAGFQHPMSAGKCVKQGKMDTVDAGLLVQWLVSMVCRYGIRTGHAQIRNCGKRISFDLYSVHGRGTGGQRIFGNTEAKGEIIGALNVKDSDEVVCMTSQGKTLRFKETDIKEQGAGASGVNVVRVTEPDYIVGIDKVQEKEDE